MKKEKITILIIVCLITFVFVCTMFVQFKVVKQTDIAQIEGMREEELEKAVLEWKEKYSTISEKIIEIDNKTNEYAQKSYNDAESKELIKKELEEARESFGYTDVVGDGLIITLEDNNEQTFDSNDLITLINILKSAGAEVISINDERIVTTTDIVDISNKYIMLDNNKISSPYVIKVIGDKTYLKSALTIKNGYVDIRTKEGYSINLQEKYNLKIEKYDKEINLKYIEL